MPHLNNKQNKTKLQTQLSAGRITPHSALPIREKMKKQQKRSTNLTLCEAYTNHWTKLRRAETKRKKEFNPETLEKETSNTIRLKK